MIGHEQGQLTLNVAEADDVHREAMRNRLSEPYRTMLGHLRHEVGHFYWYRLVENTELIDDFRALFGDERADYAAALAAHYGRTPTDGWQEAFVSFYASAHPWEDFAETWAHYIHIVDTLETAHDSRLALAGRDVTAPLPLGGRAAVHGHARRLVAAHRCVESTEPQHGNARRLSVRAYRSRRRQARVRPPRLLGRGGPRFVVSAHINASRSSRIARRRFVDNMRGCAPPKSAPPGEPMRTKYWLLFGTMGLVPLAHVAAHHAPTMLYDLSMEISVTGVVTEFQLGNPHMRIYLDVDNNGTIEKWLAEGGSRTQLMRVGWTDNEVKPGDKVIVRGHPPRDASAKHLIHMEYLTLPDGTERFAEDIQYDEFIERRRRRRMKTRTAMTHAQTFLRRAPFTCAIPCSVCCSRVRSALAQTGRSRRQPFIGTWSGVFTTQDNEYWTLADIQCFVGCPLEFYDSLSPSSPIPPTTPPPPWHWPARAAQLGSRRSRRP